MALNCICEPGQLHERNGHSASCNRLSRKLESDLAKEEQRTKAKLEALKQPKKQQSIAKVGTKNLFECSDGSKVTQTEINKRLSASHVQIFRSKEFGNEQLPRVCKGCGAICHSTAHIIAKARCKVLRKTELIWYIENQFPACFACNAAIENPNGTAWTKLNNIQTCLQFIMEHDPQLYIKFQLKAQEIGFSIKQVEPHAI
jgi:hypothetical protein